MQFCYFITVIFLIDTDDFADLVFCFFNFSFLFSAFVIPKLPPLSHFLLARMIKINIMKTIILKTFK